MRTLSLPLSRSRSGWRGTSTGRTRRAPGAVLIALCGLLALLVSACGGNSGSQTADALPDSQQVLQNVITGVQDIATLDPAIVQEVPSSTVLNLLWPALLTENEKLQPIPWAADAMPTTSADGLTHTFHLHSGMKFSDGEPIDAAAFAYSINRAADPCTASPVAYYLYAIKDAQTFNGERCNSDGSYSAAQGQKGPVLKTLIGDSLTVQDAQTLVITLAQPAAYFLQAITYPTSYAVPQNLIKQYGAKWVDHLADNGGLGGNLFKLTEWDHAGNIKLVRNDSFWGAKPKLREMDFTIYKSSDTAYNTYLAGQGDVGFPPTAQLAAARTKPDFHEVGQLWIDYYLPNWKIPPFDDVRVRQAFALALDKNALANDVLHGAVIPSNHIVPQGMPGYNADLKGVDGGQGLTSNTTMATQLAQQYAAEKCGGSFANCPPVTLTYSTGSQDELNQDQAALAMWQKAFPGWKIKISGTDFNTLITQENTRTLQFWSIAWVADYPDAQDWLSLQFLPTAQYNDGSANVPDANTLMTKADGETDQAQRIKDYNAAEQLLVTNVAWIPLYQVKLQYEARQYVKNFILDAQAFTPLDVMQNVYIAKH